jgi:hypothetical protein
MTVRALNGGAEGAEGGERARRLRVIAFLRRAVQVGGGDTVCVVAEGTPEPVVLLPMGGELDTAERLADEVCAAVADDAAASRTGRYRVLVQRADETLGALSIRVRSDAADHPLDASLRRAGETAQDGIIRQLMRHQEGFVRLMLERDSRRADAEARREDRIAARLEDLERRAAEGADRRVELLRVEHELARELAAAERQEMLTREAVRHLGPAAAQLAATVTRRIGAGTAPAAPPAPARPAPQLADDNSHAARTLTVLQALPPDALEALVAFVPAEHAAALRDAYGARKVDAPNETG